MRACTPSDLCHHVHMIYTEDDGIRADENTPPERDLDRDGIVEDGLGHPAAETVEGGGD